MNSEQSTEYINFNDFDWKSYYEKGKESLKKDLESNEEMFDAWTVSNKQYMLICYPNIVENNIENKSGRVTGHLECHISSDKIEDLRIFWNSKFIQERYDTTRQHFIADIKNRKIIEFLSVCM